MPPAYLRGPSVPVLKYWGCTSKRSFPTEEHARMAGHRTTEATKGKPMLTYQCPRCNGWHLTTHKLTADERVTKKIALRSLGVNV